MSPGCAADRISASADPPRLRARPQHRGRFHPLRPTASAPITPGQTQSATYQHERGERTTEYHIVKRFYKPQALQRRLAELGWNAQVRTTREFFIYGQVTPSA
jgi:hypothetical protein